MKVSLGVAVRFLLCDLEVTGSNLETASPTGRGEDVYIYSPPTPPT
jgi:hypothetical protein